MSTPDRSGRVPRPSASSGLHRLPTEATAHRPAAANYNLDQDPILSEKPHSESAALSFFGGIFASDRFSAGLMVLLLLGLVAVMLSLLTTPLTNAFIHWTQRTH